MYRYFVVLLLIALQYTANGQLEGTTTASSNVEITTDLIQNGTIPIISPIIFPRYCPPNEIWSTSGKICEPMCEERIPIVIEITRPPYFRCPLIRCMAGCRCQEGYLRNTYTNQCVLPEDCNRRL